MPLTPLSIQPGIYKESSELGAANRNRWSDGDLIRFWKGQPEPIGGWQAESFTGDTFYGIPRGLLDWTDLVGNHNIAIGTHQKLYAYRGGQIADITPARETGTLGADPFTTTIGSSIVEVNDSSHGLAVGAFVSYSGASAVGGITIDGEYQVSEVVDLNTYKIVDDEVATSTATGGGVGVSYVYLINPGNSTASIGLGWGAGAWGAGTWGTPRIITTTLLYPRTWHMDTWGEDLIVNPRGGGIYAWDPTPGLTGNRAVQIPNSPETALAVLVHPEARHLMAFGAHDGSNDDPLFIRWSSQNDREDWTPTETNTAGDARLEDGSVIMSAIRSPLGNILVLTDESVYSMEYIGPPYIFNLHQVSTFCGLIGPNAAATLKDKVWYMGNENFFVYDGTVRILECDVQSFIYDDLDRNNPHKIFMSTIKGSREVVLFYPSISGGTGEPDKYALYNIEENHWSVGNMARTCWRDRSSTFELPFAMDADGNLYTQERTDIFPEGAFIESGELNMGQGDTFMLVDRVIPDFERNAGTVNFTIKAKRYPGATEEFSKGPYGLTLTTEKVDFRLRGRQIQIRLDSDEIDWRLAGLRLRAKPSGRR